jgi:hypothetical protein
MKKGLILLAVLLSSVGPFAFTLAGGWAPAAHAATCTPTGFVRDSINLTAALINPGNVTGEVDATGCNIGVYYGPGATGGVSGANIHGANYFGVVNDGATVNIQNSDIHDIGETPFNGSQHGVSIYFALGSSAGGTISGNHIWHYQKGGIVVNGEAASATIRDNIVTGLGPVGFIAQNGIQVGYGADASVMRNTVSDNSYTGTSTVSGGIVVVGGPYYGLPYTVGTQIVGNTVVNNDIGVFLTNLAADGSAPNTATNIKTVNNTISNNAVTSGYGYQAGVSDVGNNDQIINNTISGVGYTPVPPPGPYLVPIDADESFTNRPKVHANK